MICLRSLVWLVALVAFAVPAIGPASAGHAKASAPMQETEATVSGCAEHAPPPDCPDEGTAKHAAGQCCPLMSSCAGALLPPADIAGAAPFLSRGVAAAVRHLTGLDFTKDPPPPRV